MSSLGEAIHTARLAAGLTQTELAERVGVSQAAMTRYEKDLRDPRDDRSGGVFSRLCAELGVTERFLVTAGTPLSATAVDAHMRRRATANVTAWRRLEAQLNMLRMHAQLMADEVSMKTSLELPSIDPFETSPQQAAIQHRMQWRMPIGPVRHLTRWMEAAGCLIITADFGTSRVDGLSQWAGGLPVILINATMPTDRRRWTLAHELGHLVLHSQDLPPTAENQANEFAAEFLTPASVIRPQLRGLTLGRARDLKTEWEVSIQAIIMRAADLGTITTAQKQSLFKQLSARGWRQHEPGSEMLPDENPELLASLRGHLDTMGLDPQEIATMTGFSSDLHNDLIPPIRRLRAV